MCITRSLSSRNNPSSLCIIMLITRRHLLSPIPFLSSVSSNRAMLLAIWIMQSSSFWLKIVLYIPTCRPDGDVVVVSRQHLNKLLRLDVVIDVGTSLQSRLHCCSTNCRFGSFVIDGIWQVPSRIELANFESAAQFNYMLTAVLLLRCFYPRSYLSCVTRVSKVWCVVLWYVKYVVISLCCRWFCSCCCWMDRFTNGLFCWMKSCRDLFGRSSNCSRGISKIALSVCNTLCLKLYRALIWVDSRDRISGWSVFWWSLLLRFDHRVIIAENISLMSLVMNEDPFPMVLHWLWNVIHDVLNMPENRLCQPRSVCESMAGCIQWWVELGGCWSRKSRMFCRTPLSIHWLVFCLWRYVYMEIDNERTEQMNGE